MPFINRLRNAAMVATASAGLVLAGHATASALPAPAVTVTPSAGLADGASVAVTATGFPAGTEVFVVQCTNAPAESTACDVNRAVGVVTDEAGNAATTLTVHRTFDGFDLSGNPVPVDCATVVNGCAVAVATVTQEGAATPISFG